MKNCTQTEGVNIDVVAPRNVVSGEYVLMSDHLGGVASFDAVNGTDLVIVTGGVFTLTKADTADAFAVGSPAYAGDLDGVQSAPDSAASALIGVCVVASGAGVSTVATKLTDVSPA